MEQTSAWQSQAERRSQIYAWLSVCLYQPSIDFSAAWLKGSVLEALNEIQYFIPDGTGGAILDRLDDLRKEQRQRSPEDLLAKLKLEYMRLFIGPGQPTSPPYESFYRKDPQRQYKKGLLMGTSTLQVAEQYRRAGVEIAPDHTDLPDHISSELEFMHYLTSRERDAWAAEFIPEGIQWLQHEAQFLDQNLAAWVLDFAQAVEKGSEDLLYRGISRLTALFVTSDQKEVQQFLSQSH